MTRMPEPDALRFAAEWLRSYDDSHDGGKQTATAERVADWLDEQAEAKEIRAYAKLSGLPTAKLRAALRDSVAALGSINSDNVQDRVSARLRSTS